jgi:CRP-like cAMP-binding protein/ribonuclease BN (tRNA processing enzyme)
MREPVVTVGPFTVGIGAPRIASELRLTGHRPPDVLLLDLAGLNSVPKIENLLFFQLFCAAMEDGFGVELGRINRKIMAFEKGGVGASEAVLKERHDLLQRAALRGFAPLLTPGVPAFLSRPLVVVVPDEAQAERVREFVVHAFANRDARWMAGELKRLRQSDPAACPLGDGAIERITRAFEQARSFTSAPGLFHDHRSGRAFPDEVIRREKLAAILDVRVLGPQVERVRWGIGAEAATLEIARQQQEVVVTCGRDVVSVPWEAVRTAEPPPRPWRPKGVEILHRLLAEETDTARLIDFGSGDALYVGSGEDFTNFALVHRGRLLLTDPSERTVANLLELGLLDRVEMIYQSHVHYDHLGGVMELARRFARGDRLPRFQLLAAGPVRIQMREVLRAVTGRSGFEVEEMFEPIRPSGMGTADLHPDAEGEVELLPLERGAFAGCRASLLRTRHFVPTYALRLATPHGTLAYLVDSSMPAATRRGEPNPQYADFVRYFGADSGVDVLLADCGEVEERDDNIHIAAGALLRVFPEHARRGTLWTVHSPIAQKARDLQRFEPFDVIKLCPVAARQAQVEEIAAQLLARQAFRNRAFHITEAQARRLGRVAQVRNFIRGATILRKDEDVRAPENNKVHIVLEGEVSVAEEGREIREGERLLPGDLFGERAIFGAEVAALAYWQIPERQRPRVLTRHEFESGAYFTWNPGLTEHELETHFDHEPGLQQQLLELFRQTQKLQRTRTAEVLTDTAVVLEIKADEFYKVFEHFALDAAAVRVEEREDKVRETLGALVLSAASASKRMRLDDFIALVELDHLTEVMEPILELAAAKRAGDRGKIKACKWPDTVWSNYTRIDPVSRVIDANLSAFLSFARVFHDQYVAEIEAAAFIDPTLATPAALTALVERGALDGGSERVRAYIGRYGNAKKHVKLQRQDVQDLPAFAETIAARTAEGAATPALAARENAARLVELYRDFPPKQDVLSSLYGEWNQLLAEIDTAYEPSAREGYKDYLARLQTKAIANILTILLYVRHGRVKTRKLPGLDELLLWIHAAWSLDNDWAEQAAMTWDELERIKPGDIKKDWVALWSVIEQLEFREEFRPIIDEGLAKYPVHA